MPILQSHSLSAMLNGQPKRGIRSRSWGSNLGGGAVSIVSFYKFPSVLFC